MHRPLTSIPRSRGFCLAHVGILSEPLAQGSLAALSAYSFFRWRIHMDLAQVGMDFAVEHRLGLGLDWAGKALIRGSGMALGFRKAAGDHIPGTEADPLGDSSQPRSG